MHNLTRCASLTSDYWKGQKGQKIPVWSYREKLFSEDQLFNFSNITCFSEYVVECHAQIMTQDLVLQTDTQSSETSGKYFRIHLFAELRKYSFNSTPEAKNQPPECFWPVRFVIGRFQRHKAYTFWIYIF